MTTRKVAQQSEALRAKQASYGAAEDDHVNFASPLATPAPDPYGADWWKNKAVKATLASYWSAPPAASGKVPAEKPKPKTVDHAVASSSGAGEPKAQLGFQKKSPTSHSGIPPASGTSSPGHTSVQRSKGNSEPVNEERHGSEPVGRREMTSSGESSKSSKSAGKPGGKSGKNARKARSFKTADLVSLSMADGRAEIAGAKDAAREIIAEARSTAAEARWEVPESERMPREPQIPETDPVLVMSPVPAGSEPAPQASSGAWTKPTNPPMVWQLRAVGSVESFIAGAHIIPLVMALWLWTTFESHLTGPAALVLWACWLVAAIPAPTRWRVYFAVMMCMFAVVPLLLIAPLNAAKIHYASVPLTEPCMRFQMGYRPDGAIQWSPERCIHVPTLIEVFVIGDRRGGPTSTIHNVIGMFLRYIPFFGLLYILLNEMRKPFYYCLKIFETSDFYGKERDLRHPTDHQRLMNTPYQLVFVVEARALWPSLAQWGPIRMIHAPLVEFLLGPVVYNSQIPLNLLEARMRDTSKYASSFNYDAHEIKEDVFSNSIEVALQIAKARRFETLQRLNPFEESIFQLLCLLLELFNTAIVSQAKPFLNYLLFVLVRMFKCVFWTLPGALVLWASACVSRAKPDRNQMVVIRVLLQEVRERGLFAGYQAWMVNEWFDLEPLFADSL